MWDIRTSHQGVDAGGTLAEVPFDLNEESLGTQRFFEMLGPWLDVLSGEKVFFMDEFDTGLHPVLSEYLLAHFLKTSKRSQFVFTTHNTNFLDSGLLRRDQVWLTEIDPKTRGTDLYSLAELGLRNDHNLEKGYLAGKYGGIPLPGVRS
jgi:AAA15 family ATPase/GTPase